VKTVGALRPKTLQSSIQPPTLLVVDCEGCELNLLRPDRVPALRHADLIVELHDFVDPRATDTIVGRFSGSHTVTLVESVERRSDSEVYPALGCLPRSVWDQTLAEYRPRDPHPMRWAVLEPLR
jgi:hypothetical protein